MPERQEIGTREFELSNTGSFITVTDFHKLHIISTDDGIQIASFVFEHSIYDPVFSESDSILAIGCLSHPEVTPLRPINSFGVRTVSLQNRSFEFNSDFQAGNYLSEAGMPQDFSTYTVSDNGSLIGFLYYSPDFGRCALLSADLEIVWLSENLNQNGSWSFFHFMVDIGLNSDGSAFWYFDGESIHSCLIEGM